MKSRWRLSALVCALAALVLATPTASLAEEPELHARALKELSVEELMAIEVTTVSRRPQRLSQAAASVQVITSEDIRRSGATTLPEALRLATNLEVAQIDSRQWAISARGFNSTTSNKMLVMIDGRTVYTPLFAGVFWDVQDTLVEDIDTIEVISGPGATLWGSNAVNGVINVRTKQARDTQGGLLIGAAGTELNGLGGVRHGGKIGENAYYRVYGKYFDRDDSELATGGSGVDDWHMGRVGFRTDWQPSEIDSVAFSGDLYEGDVAQAAPGDVTVSGGNLRSRWSRTLSETSDLRLQVYVDQTDRTISGTFAEDQTTFDVDFQHRFLWAERNDIVWGLGYRMVDDDVENSLALAFLPATVTRHWASGFVQDEIALIHDHLHLTLGTKLEHNDYTGLEVQPSGRIAWRPNDYHTIWAAVSRAVRTPSRIDRELFAPGVAPFLLAGGPSFDSEELLAYEAGYRVQPLASLSLSLALFYNDYDELRSIERVDPPAPFPLVIDNRLHGESYGAEIVADLRVTDGWRLRAGYTELRVDIDAEPGSTDTTSGANESHDPEHMASLRSYLDLPADWELDTGTRYVSGIENQDVDDYVEMDVRLGWRPWPELELSLVGQNVLHDEHAEFGSVSSRKEIERSIYGKVVWRY